MLSPSLESEAATREEELTRLARALRLSRGFRLYFARALPGPPRAALLEELAAAVGGGLRIFDAQPGLEHLRAALETELAGETPRAVCVTGIETWVPAGAEGAGSPFVRNLNASRDRFAAILSCPLVLWGADHVLQAVQRGAPDFFSVASGIYLFPAESSVAPETARGEWALESAARWLQDLEEIEERLCKLGPDPKGTARVDRITTLNRKVVRLLHLAHYDEAEEIARTTYEEALRIVGPDANETLSAANNLAGLYESTGRYEEAEPLFVSTLEARRRAPVPDTRDTLTSANNLADLYVRTGRYQEAEPLFVSALETSRKSFGADDPDTLHAANGLGYFYRKTGRLKKAEKLFRSTLDASCRTRGPEHPSTLACANNLASLYNALGRYAEAERIYHSTLETDRRVLGPDHPDTLRSVNNLACLYWDSGRNEAAIELLRSILPAVGRLPEGHEVREGIESNLQHWTEGSRPS